MDLIIIEHDEGYHFRLFSNGYSIKSFYTELFFALKIAKIDFKIIFSDNSTVISQKSTKTLFRSLKVFIKKPVRYKRRIF